MIVKGFLGIENMNDKSNSLWTLGTLVHAGAGRQRDRCAQGVCGGGRWVHLRAPVD